MAYSNFTLAKVYRQFQLKEKRERLFPDVEHVALSDWQFLTLHDQLVTIDTQRYYGTGRPAQPTRRTARHFRLDGRAISR